ncbi:MAG: hypothetical protein NUV80_03860, partial [Candidatus Berkelbacteria bacterium]|nr:hypothetical protein [Candidatus Berkelbacteria bacterium]
DPSYPAGSALVHIAGTETITGDKTFSGALIQTSTDAGAALAPTLDLYRDSASPAASDAIGGIDFNGEDSVGNKQLYARLLAVIQDPTSTSEDGKLQIYTTIAATSTLEAEIAGGIILGSPTGSFKGVNTLNAASGVYDNGTRILPLIVGGTGQTWYDKSGSRALTTVYQNTSGYPIMVNVDVIVNTSGSGGAAIDYLVGSANPPTIRVGYGNVTSDAHDVPISFIVPNNYYYEALGGNTIRNWAEFRDSS